MRAVLSILCCLALMATGCRWLHPSDPAVKKGAANPEMHREIQLRNIGTGGGYYGHWLSD